MAGFVGRTLDKTKNAWGERAGRNPVVKVAGTAHQVLNPWSKTNAEPRKEAKRKITDAESEHDEEVRFNKRKKLEGSEQDTEANVDRTKATGGAPRLDPKMQQGADTTIVKNRLQAAIRRSENRSAQDSDSLIREVVCNPMFVKAIRVRGIPTPMEPLDSEYEKDMLKKRNRLADQLEHARTHPDYLVGDITTHELDIIFTTMLGKAALWDNEKGWSMTGAPKPPEAFFMFLESVAQDVRPNAEGPFCAAVVYNLSLMRTFTDWQKHPARTMVDTEYISRYLYEESVGPIGWASEAFENNVTSMLMAPADRLHPELQVPCPGYAQEYANTLGEKEQKARVAAGKAGAAMVAEESAAKRNDDIAKMKAEADDKGSVDVPSASGTVTLAKDSPQLAQLVESAGDALDQARGAREEAEAQLAEIQKDLEKYRKNSSPESIAKELTREFKGHLLRSKDRIDDKNIGNIMAERQENKALMDLLKQAEELKTERASFDRLLLMKRMSEGVAGKQAKVADDDVFGKRIDAFEEKMEAFRQELAAAPIPAETRERLAWMATTLGNLEFAATIKPKAVKDASGAHDHATKALTEQTEYISREIDDIRKTHGQPIRKVVELSLKKAKERKESNPLGISDGQRMLARSMFEEISTDPEHGVTKHEGSFKSAINWILQNVFDPNVYINTGRRVFLHILPGKQFFGDYNKSEKRYTGGDLLYRNWFQKITWPDQDADGNDILHVSTIPRIVSGVFWAGLKSYIILPAAFSLVVGSGEGHWYKPWSWPSAGIRATGLVNGPLYINDASSHLYYPWTWFLPVESQRDTRAYRDDSYDIAWKLPERGYDVYRSQYGVGNALPGEEYERTNWLAANVSDRLCGIVQCDGPTERLNWLENHPDVLKFLQERTSMRRFVSVKDIGAGPENCTNPKEAIPKSCQDPDGLNFMRYKDAKAEVPDIEASWRAIADYEPATIGKEGWDPKMGVCCTIDLSTYPVDDGRVLNRYESDRFVDTLMALEGKAKKVNYWFLTDPKNAAFVESIVDQALEKKDKKEEKKDKEAFMTKLAELKKSNTKVDAAFLAKPANKAFADALGKVGDTEMVMDHKFLTHPTNMMNWTTQGFLITAAEKDLVDNIKTTNRSNVAFLHNQGSGRISTFVNMCGMKGRAERWVKEDKRDAFVGNWMAEVKKAIPGVNLAIAYVPEDVLNTAFDTTKAAAEKSGWVENTEPEFRRYQIANKMKRLLSIDVSKPLDLPTVQALDVLTAKDNEDIVGLLGKFEKSGVKYYASVSSSREFIQKLAEHKAAKGKVEDYDPFTDPPGYLVQYAVGKGYITTDAAPQEGRMDIPKLSEEAKRFYTSTSQELFTKGVELSIQQLHEDKRADGKLAAEVMGSAFGGATAAIDESLKQWIYVGFASVKDPVTYATDSGILVTKDTGNAVTAAEVKDADKARMTLRSRMLNLLKKLKPAETTAPASPPAKN
ncbi:hypothetical protein H0O00_05600 [Candidatus Micrarchaeota archaeon]|nr:hypothetical protein [Candidatus Micrarchaeota archaeon]